MVGLDCTPIDNMQGVLNLADWARWLVVNWNELNIQIWQFALGWIGIRVPEGIAPILSYVAFCFMTAFGARHFAKGNTHNWRNVIIWYLVLNLVGIAIASGLMLYLVTRLKWDSSWYGTLSPATNLALMLASAFTLIYLNRNNRVVTVGFIMMITIFSSIILNKVDWPSFLSFIPALSSYLVSLFPLGDAPFLLTYLVVFVYVIILMTTMTMIFTILPAAMVLI